jgi:hypothetical protein
VKPNHKIGAKLRYSVWCDQFQIEQVEFAESDPKEAVLAYGGQIVESYPGVPRNVLLRQFVKSVTVAGDGETMDVRCPGFQTRRALYVEVTGKGETKDGSSLENIYTFTRHAESATAVNGEILRATKLASAGHRDEAEKILKEIVATSGGTSWGYHAKTVLQNLDTIGDAKMDELNQGGTIVATGNGVIQIKAKDGKTHTFQLEPQTKVVISGRGKTVNVSHDALQPGQNVTIFCQAGSQVAERIHLLGRSE